MVKSYRELIVWQKSIEACRLTYLLVKKLPKEELYALSDQMKRAAISIPSNIAEGQSRNSKNEFIHFLSIARGSKSELETQFLLCKEIGYLSDEEIQPAMTILEEIGKMISSLTRKLKGGE